MGLAVGIVGLPNVGKSTLFNALSAKRAEAANYAFCTIEPNVAVVPVPDPRFDALVELYRPERVVPATVEFVDIAGLVRGASRGEGRGNAFLANIREADAIAHVVRCFEDENVAHIEGQVDPVQDIETIETELALKDLETVQRRHDKARRAAKGHDKTEIKALEVCQRLEAMLDRGEPASLFAPDDETEATIVRELSLLTRKACFYVANVDEHQLGRTDDPTVDRVRRVAEQRGRSVIVISAEIEAEIMQLAEQERAEFLESVGLEEPGLNHVIRTGYGALDLITFYTCGTKREARAWTIKRGTKAPQAAGKIHSDMERGFIRAEVIHWRDLVDHRSESAVKAAGKMSVEGKDYVVRDGDVIHFRFNV